MQESIILVSLFFISFIYQCSGVSLQRQLEHIAKTRLESQGLSNDIVPSRRYQFDPRELTKILGVPNKASHLPEAESILPGHTLNRPAVGMLKSSVKFPHKDLEDGAGVYGSIDNLGIKYDSKNERLLYTGFRRFPSDYIMVIPSASGANINPRFKLQPAVLDLDKKDTRKDQLLKIIKRLNNPAITGNVRIYFGDMNNNFLNNLRTSEEFDTSYNRNKNVNEDHENRPNSIKVEKINCVFVNSDKTNSVIEVILLIGEKSVLRIGNETEAEKLILKYLTSDEHEVEASNQDNNSKKIQWLYNSKDVYNHIKINQEAPELNDLVPPIDDDQIRKWWFYNADDYKQFS